MKGTLTLPADEAFSARLWRPEDPRPGDSRDPYQRDKARIIHSAGFRRLQAKTQVMGIGEGDFHRTRLTHSIEAGQIGEGILATVKRKYANDMEITEWLPSVDLVVASCYAHDLGHPPFGHGGEKALHARMVRNGGFEGNGQTLRILTRLEKYWPLEGINPTRRLVLAVLKYPMPYSAFPERPDKPPKCYFDSEQPIIDWALSRPFLPEECELFTSAIADGEPAHRSLDSSLMECADDIAYGVHDLEDIVARRLVREADIVEGLEAVLHATEIRTWADKKGIGVREFKDNLSSGAGSTARKSFVGHLVNLFVSSAEIRQETGFRHPLLRYRVGLPGIAGDVLTGLKTLTLKLVVQRAEVQQLERRGQRIIADLFDQLLTDPQRLIPKEAWTSLAETDPEHRRVCDYVAGMTDRYAERIYQRLFTPGFGSSRDEL